MKSDSMKPEIDFRVIATAALAQAESFVKEWLPDGRMAGAEWVALNPTRNDQHPGSFKINLHTGRWSDFADNASGGDLISLYAYLNRLAQGQAARFLADRLNMNGVYSGVKPPVNDRPPKKPEWTPLKAVPGDAPEPPAAHPKNGKPTAVWIYHDVSGERMFYVYRFDFPGKKKEFAPLTWCVSPDGKTAEWRWQGIPEQRPLYQLPRLLARPDAPVMVCEGEKSADAAANLLPDWVVTTSSGGSNAPQKTDWTPLAGRRVTIWPDHDEPGRRYAAAVTKLAQAAGAATVRTLKPERLDVELTEGWDAANEGAAERLAAMLAEPKPAACSKFSLRQDGLYWHGDNPDGETESLWICSPLHIEAQTCDEHNNSWGRLLVFKDNLGKEKRWAMPIRLLANDGLECRQALLDMGLNISPDSKPRKLLNQYLQNSNPQVWARCVERTGWHRGAYMLPSGEMIGTPALERLLLQNSVPPTNQATAGTLEDWKQHVAAYCQGNSRLVFSVSVAFASLLLSMTGDENGGFHLRGASSVGKTTALRVAASVFGDRSYLKTWRATANGLESIAIAHHDALLILDEIGQVDALQAGEIAYMLANGAGKHRADKYGNAKSRRTWRLLFLSTGELSLADHMSSCGKRAKAGQEIRLADIPVDTGQHGAFEQLHGFTKGKEFADFMMAAANRCYGEASRAFLQRLVITDPDAICKMVNGLANDFSAEHLPENASGQAERMARRVALVAAAGELATSFEITGWQDGEATRAAGICFQAWLSARGGAERQEDAAALAQIRRFFELHGESRFSLWDSHDDRVVPNRAGFRRLTPDGLEFYVFPEVFKTELCAGFDPRQVARLLVDRGWLKPSSEGKFQIHQRLPGIGSKKVYTFTTQAFGASVSY